MAAITANLRVKTWPLDRQNPTNSIWIGVAEASSLAEAGGYLPASALQASKILAVISAHIENATAAAGGAKATGTITFNDTGTADETITIDGIVYTLKATPTAAFEVDLGADATASAANLRDAINRGATAGTDYGANTAPHPTVSASAAAGVVTITARVPGADGNAITLAASDTTTSFTLSDTVLSGGAAASGGGVRAFPNSQTASATEDDNGDIFVDHAGGAASTVRVTYLFERIS